MKNLLLGTTVILCIFLAAGGIMTLSAQNAGDIGSVPVGSITAWAGKANATPDGWRVCNGASLNRSAYPELFAAIGTVWGSEDEESFNLPDLRGRFLRGVDFGTGRDTDAGKREACNPGGNERGVGTVQEDSIQSHTFNHTHIQEPHQHDANTDPPYLSADLFYGPYPQVQAGTDYTLIQFDSYGQPTPAAQPEIGEAQALAPDPGVRFSAETRPKNAAVVYIIRVN